MLVERSVPVLDGPSFYFHYYGQTANGVSCLRSLFGLPKSRILRCQYDKYERYISTDDKPMADTLDHLPIGDTVLNQNDFCCLS